MSKITFRSLCNQLQSLLLRHNWPSFSLQLEWKWKVQKNARSILYLLSSKSIQETISKGPVPVIVPPTTMVPVSELGTGFSHLKYKSSHWNANWKTNLGWDTATKHIKKIPYSGFSLYVPYQCLFIFVYSLHGSFDYPLKMPHLVSSPCRASSHHQRHRGGSSRVPVQEHFGEIIGVKEFSLNTHHYLQSGTVDVNISIIMKTICHQSPSSTCCRF